MDNTIIVSIISLAGTLLGSLCGVLASQRLTQHRLQELEKKVDKHNHLVERMAVAEKEIRVANHRIENLEAYHK